MAKKDRVTYAEQRSYLFHLKGNTFTAKEFRAWVAKQSAQHVPGLAPTEHELYNFADSPLGYALGVRTTDALIQLEEGAGRQWREAKRARDESKAEYDALVKCLAHQIADEVVATSGGPNVSVIDEQLFIDNQMNQVKDSADRGNELYKRVQDEARAIPALKRRFSQHYARALETSDLDDETKRSLKALTPQQAKQLITEQSKATTNEK